MSNNTSTTPAPVVPRASPPKSLDDLIAEQGIRPLEQFESLFGAGRDLWTDEEFAALLQRVKSTRREKE